MIQRAGFYRICLCIAVCLAMLPLQAQTAAQAIFAAKPAASPQQKASPSPAASATPVQAIPLPQIAGEAEELERLLRDISRHLGPVTAETQSPADAQAEIKELARRAGESEDALAGITNVIQLQDEDRYWKALADQFIGQRKALTDRADAIQKHMAVLDTEQARWKATAEQVHATPGLEVVYERVKRELDALQQLRSDAQEQLSAILIQQNRISERERVISGVLLKLDEMRTQMRGRLLRRDSYPLWAPRELRLSDQPITSVLYLSLDRGFTGAPTFFLSHKGTFLLGVAIYICMLFATLHLRRYLQEQPGPDHEMLLVFARPFSVALLITLLITIGIATEAPSGVSFVVSLMYLVPVLRLLPRLLGPEMRKLLYAISAIYAIEWLHMVLKLSPAFHRELYTLVMLAAFVTFAWLARPSLLKMETASNSAGKLLIAGIRVGVAMLALSCLASITGFVSLSQIIGVGTLFSGFIFVLLYTLVKVLHMALVVLLNSNWFRSFGEGHIPMVERWGRRLLIAATSVLWVNIYLYLFTVRDVVLDSLSNALDYPIGFGKVHITLGGTLTLFFFLFVGYAIANAARFILEELILPRLQLQGGLTYAISRVTYYVLLAGIFFAAITNAGVELNKFTVISGALGLGVGFGLQNIVNNFASGLIILFERPFRVGDTVEVGGVVGLVKRIGARSSTILTFQYAEVIVPNSNLLSNQVINWTLTSARRRVEIPVGVAYGTDPEKALKLLTNVANANLRILRDPPPEAFFLGFGDSALNLELRFWASQALWFELKSEIGISVFRALREAGIEIPFPQRDLHVRSVEAVSKEALTVVSDKESAKKVATAI